MNKWKKWISGITLVTMMISAPQDGNAREFCTSTGGCAYEEAYESCCLAPAIALAIVLIAGIIAVGVHNRSSSGHQHLDSDSI